jgi:hypothetical protein
MMLESIVSKGPVWALTALVLLVACTGSTPTPEELANGNDPLASLRSSVRSARYDGTFWNGEARQDTELWLEAVAYCRGPGNSAAPNCQTVGLVLATIELEKAADEARRQLLTLLEQGEALAGRRREPAAGAHD